MTRLPVLLLALPILAAAQAVSPFAAPPAAVDPATCVAGSLYFNSGGGIMKYCSATNVWTAFGTTSPLFSALLTGVNTTADMRVDTGAAFTLQGTVPLTLTGQWPGNASPLGTPFNKEILNIDLRGSPPPANASTGLYFNWFWPAAAARGTIVGTDFREYHGISTDYADPAFSGGCAFCVFNAGQGNSYYSNVAGQGSVSGGLATSGAISSIGTGVNPTVTTTTTIPMNGPPFFVLIAGFGSCSGANGSHSGTWSGSNTFVLNATVSGSCTGSGAWALEPAPVGLALDMNGAGGGQNNANFVGWGLTVTDYTTSLSNEPNGGIPIFVQKHSVGNVSNPTMKWRNDDGPLYFDRVAGSAAEQIEADRFLNKAGTVIILAGKNASGQYVVSDAVNSRDWLRATPGASSLPDFPNSLSLSGLTPSSPLCLDGSGHMTTSGCTGGGGAATSYVGNRFQFGVLATGFEVSAGDCGLVMDGTSGSTNQANLTNCLNGTTFALPANFTGITLRLPPGVLALTSGVTITKDNIRIIGAGGYADSSLNQCQQGLNPPGCRGKTIIQAVTGTWGNNHPVLTWDGTGSAATGKQNATYLTNPGLEGVDIDANNLASQAVNLKNVTGGVFRDFHFHDFTSTLAGGEYGLTIPSGNTTTSGSTCGSNSGITIFENGEIQSYRTGAGAINLGVGGSTAPDVCSFRFSNLFLQTNLPVGMHSIYLWNTDSNQFSNIHAYGFTGQSVASITGTSATTATLVTSSPHNMPSGTTGDGVYLEGASVLGLHGTLTADYVNSTTVNLSGASGLTNGGSYSASAVYGAAVELGGVGATEDHNMFSQIFANHGLHNRGNQFNLVTGYNSDSEDPTYDVPGGNPFTVLQLDGSLYGMTVRDQLNLAPPKIWPNSLMKFTGTVPDFNVVIDLQNAATTTSSGYAAMAIHNNTSILSALNGGGGTFTLISSDTSNNVILGNPFGSQNNTHLQAPSGKLIVADSPLQLINGSGGLKILDAGASPFNAMSATGSAGASILNFGSQTGGFKFFTSSGQQLFISDQALVQLHGVTFASLPACSGTTVDAIVAVTDGTSTTFGAVGAGGGSARVLMHCNGANWTVSGV